MYTQVIFDVHVEKMCIIISSHFLSEPCRNAQGLIYTRVQLCMRKCKISKIVKIHYKDYWNNTQITACQRSSVKHCHLRLCRLFTLCKDERFSAMCRYFPLLLVHQEEIQWMIWYTVTSDLWLRAVSEKTHQTCWNTGSWVHTHDPFSTLLYYVS